MSNFIRILFWEQRKLGDIASFENGRAFKQKELLDQGKYPVLRVGNFYTNSKWYYSNLELSENKYANKGDLLYTWSATFGPHIWRGKKVIYHYHIWNIKFKGTLLNKLFLLYFLDFDKSQLLSNTNGSTMIHVTKTNMENKRITFPNVNEQTQIGNILKKLNNLISLQQRKLRNYVQIKKNLLEKLYPDLTEIYPILRFKDFDNKFVIYRLTKLINQEKKGKAKATMEGKDSVYLDTNYLNGGKISYVDSPIDVHKNDIIILWDGSQAGTVYYGFEGALGSTLKAYVPKESGRYIYYYLSKNQERIFKQYRTPNIPHVIKDFSSKFKIPMTQKNEQEKISNILNIIEQNIDIKKNQIQVLKEVKKFLLQNMFI